MYHGCINPATALPCYLVSSRPGKRPDLQLSGIIRHEAEPGGRATIALRIRGWGFESLRARWVFPTPQVPRRGPVVVSGQQSGPVPTVHGEVPPLKAMWGPTGGTSDFAIAKYRARHRRTTHVLPSTATGVTDRWCCLRLDLDRTG